MVKYVSTIRSMFTIIFIIVTVIMSSFNNYYLCVAQHAPPIPVNVPSIQRLNQDHTLPTKKRQIEDHITLTTKRKPWRGPSKLSTLKLKGYKHKIEEVLPTRLKLLNTTERVKFNNDLAKQQDFLRNIANGNDVAPPLQAQQQQRNNIQSGTTIETSPSTIKELAGEALNAITNLRQTGQLRWSTKEKDVLNQVANGQFRLPVNIHGKAQTSKYENKIIPLYSKKPTQTMDSLLQQSKPSHHGRLANNKIDKLKMEGDWKKFIKNKKNLIPPLEGVKKHLRSQSTLSPHHRQNLQSFEQHQQQMHSRQQQFNNQGQYGVKGVDIDSFDPFEHDTETNEQGRKKAPILREPPSHSLGVIAGGPRVGIAGNGGGSGSISAQILQSAPQYQYTKLDKSAWPAGGNS